ncbi:MAG: class I adenylate-forming enzyme family protein, partial [Actinomycetota bacterium]
YWNAPAESRLRDGWLWSGDIGYQSEDGYLYLCGRADDVINVGGQKVYPTEVEDALRQHDVVADCVCVGASDPKNITGESVVAFVVAREDRRNIPSSRELSAFLMSKLDLFKIPVAYDWVPSIPKNAHGKVERGLLKQQIMNRSQPDA